MTQTKLEEVVEMLGQEARRLEECGRERASEFYGCVGGAHLGAG